MQLHPKSFVMTSPRVVRGESILVIVYDPESAWSEPGEPGQFSGWTFVESVAMPQDADLYFFEQLGLDAHAEDVVETGFPGIYVRESGSSTFEREED